MNPDTKAGIDRYVKDGVPPGDFLRAVLSNNLSESFGLADLENRRDMFEIVSYLYNKVPMDVWGSLEKVQAHLDMKRRLREIKVEEDFNSST